jgi:hypothetical protein
LRECDIEKGRNSLLDVTLSTLEIFLREGI